jgi:SAM-dependent methyltransferase
MQYRLFDFILGVKTSEFVTNSELDIHPDVKANVTSYSPTTLTQMLWSFWALKKIYPAKFKAGDWHLFDLGSGRGRVCFFGALVGFQKVTGIELSEALHKSALENLVNVHFSLRDKIEFIFGDCREFKLAHSKNVIFLFNPFDSGILQVILDLIENAQNHGVEIILIYVNCRYQQMVQPYFKASQTFGRCSNSVIFW